MNTNITSREQQAVRRYLEVKGYEVVEQNWAHGSDAIDFIADDGEDLVFIACSASQNTGEGMPVEEVDRKAFERIAAAYLAEAEGVGSREVRYDHVHLLVIGEGRALLRHHINALSVVG